MTDELAHLLADSLDALESGDATLEQCLTRRPEHRAELEPLLMAAQVLRDAPEAQPSLDFRRTARARLLRRLPPRAPSLTPLARLRSLWQRLTLPMDSRRLTLRWAALVISVLALLGGGTAAYASNEALPGEALYPVKLWIEAARLATASAAEASVLRVEFAGRRLDEAETLAQLGRAAQAEDALAAYASGMQNALDRARLLNNAVTVRALSESLAQDLNRVESLSAQLSAEALTSVELTHAVFDESVVLADQLGDAPPSLITPPPSRTPLATRTLRVNQTALPATLTALPTSIAATKTALPTSIAATRTALPTITLPTLTRSPFPPCVPVPIPTQWQNVIPTTWPTCAPGTPWPTVIVHTPMPTRTPFPTFATPAHTPSPWPTLNFPTKTPLPTWTKPAISTPTVTPTWPTQIPTEWATDIPPSYTPPPNVTVSPNATPRP